MRDSTYLLEGWAIQISVLYILVSLLCSSRPLLLKIIFPGVYRQLFPADRLGCGQEAGVAEDELVLATSIIRAELRYDCDLCCCAEAPNHNICAGFLWTVQEPRSQHHKLGSNQFYSKTMVFWVL